jgi:hypothetical protein
MKWWQRLFRRKRKEGELPEHVELWMRELIDEGIDPQAAREEALRGFGLEKETASPEEKPPEVDYPPICMKLSRLP